MGNDNLVRFSRRIGYTFHHLSLLKQALTHCSVGGDNNERLEFLGDSILGFVIASALFQNFPQLPEGNLSRLRAFLVKEETLNEIAIELALGDYLFLGQGELKSGGMRRASILADALEAVFAAVFLDGGLENAQTLILKLYDQRLKNPHLSSCLKDAKTQLQEYLQARKKPLPEYQIMRIEGEEHEQTFYITCQVLGLALKTVGKGSSRKKAEQDAAVLFLQALLKNPPW